MTRKKLEDLVTDGEVKTVEEARAADAVRARPTRAQEETVRRRRRAENFDHSLDQRLAVDDTKLDHTKFTYRWFNDEPGRVATFTQKDDWDPVNPDDVGGQTSYPVGYHPDGSVKRAVLMRKPREWHEKDQRAKIVRSQQEEAELMRSAPSVTGGLNDDVGYALQGVNRVRAGTTRTEIADLASSEE